jgi:hypothetical protein
MIRMSLFPIHSILDGHCSRNIGCEHPADNARTAHGFLDASFDNARITQRWTRWPFANISLAMDSPAGSVFLGVDQRTVDQTSVEAPIECALLPEMAEPYSHAGFNASVRMWSHTHNLTHRSSCTDSLA